MGKPGFSILRQLRCVYPCVTIPIAMDLCYRCNDVNAQNDGCTREASLQLPAMLSIFSLTPFPFGTSGAKFSVHRLSLGADWIHGLVILPLVKINDYRKWINVWRVCVCKSSIMYHQIFDIISSQTIYSFSMIFQTIFSTLTRKFEHPIPLTLPMA